MLKNSPIDEKIVQLLQEDGRQSSNVMARQLGISSATVRRRIKNMVQSGLLKMVGLIDPDKAGYPFGALISLDVGHDKLDGVLKALSKRPEVIWLAATTGRYDVIAFAHFQESGQFSAFLRQEIGKIDGVRDSETFLCLHIEKGRHQRFH